MNIRSMNRRDLAWVMLAAILFCTERPSSAAPPDVAVNPAHPTQKISDQFYGINVHPSTAAFEFGDAQLVRDLAPDVLRFMVMNRTDYPLDKPSVRYELSPEPGVYNWNLVDDLLDVTQAVGAKAYVALGFGAPPWLGEEVKRNRRRVTPEEIPTYAQVMGDIVAHIDQKYPGLLSAVTIDNEPNNLRYDLDVYLQLVAAASQAIRAVNSDIPIAGPVTAYASWPQSDGRQLSFNSSMTILSQANPGYNLIDWHMYTRNVSTVAKTVQIVKRHWPDMPMVISELNRNTHYGKDAAGQQAIADNTGWGSVVWLAETYDVLQREGVDQVHYFELADNTFGLYDYRQTETRPAYHLFHLMTTVMGRQRVEAESRNDNVGVIATLDDSGQLVVLLYNRSDQPQSVSLQLTGHDAATTIDLYELEQTWYEQHKAIIDGKAQLLEPHRMLMPTSFNLQPESTFVFRVVPEPASAITTGLFGGAALTSRRR